MQVPRNRIIALGDVSPWGRQFLQSLEASNLIEVGYEPSVQEYCNRTENLAEYPVFFIENHAESRTWVLSLRDAAKTGYLVWFGRSFSKDDYRFALENRIYILFENLRTDDQRIVDWLTRLSESREKLLKFMGVIRSAKAMLLQTDPENIPQHLISEMKTAVTKMEQAGGHNEFAHAYDLKSVGSETRLPFHRTQEIADAIRTVSDLERTGVLWVKGSLPGQEAKLEFIQGKIVSALCGDVQGIKAVWRAFLWDTPRFLFSRADSRDFSYDEHLNIDLNYICEGGQKQKERFEQVRKSVPPPNLKLELEPASLHKSTQLASEDFFALASVVESGTVAEAVDGNSAPDVDLYESLIRLKRSNMVRVAAGK